MELFIKKHITDNSDNGMLGELLSDVLQIPNVLN